jgi:hypothetical protein
MPETQYFKTMHSAPISPGWPVLLFSLTISIVILVTVIGFSLNQYERFLMKQSGDISKEISDLEKSIPPEDLSRITKLNLQIKNLKSLLPQHIYFSRLLDDIERLTLLQVRYLALTINKENKNLTIRGFAPSPDLVSKQAASLAQSSFINLVKINNANRVGTGIFFELEVEFKPDMLKASQK